MCLQIKTLHYSNKIDPPSKTLQTLRLLQQGEQTSAPENLVVFTPLLFCPEDRYCSCIQSIDKPLQYIYIYIFGKTSVCRTTVSFKQPNANQRPSKSTSTCTISDSIPVFDASTGLPFKPTRPVTVPLHTMSQLFSRYVNCALRELSFATEGQGLETVENSALGPFCKRP